MFKKFLLSVVPFRSLAILLSFLCGCSSTETRQTPTQIELRGVMITSEDGVFSNSQQIADAMQFLAEHNFNVVYPVVWMNGRTLYPSKVLKSEFRIEPTYGNRDPLAEVVEEAHKRDMKVIIDIVGE